MRNLPGSSSLLEIGTFCGFSANVITYYKAIYGKANPLITVDLWRFTEMTDPLRRTLSPAQPLSRDRMRQFIEESYRRNVQFFSNFDLPVFITGGLGFIGGHLAAELLLQGYRATLYDCRTHGEIRLAKLHYFLFPSHLSSDSLSMTSAGFCYRSRF